MLSTEINHAVGEDAVLVHHLFRDADALVHYFSTTATEHTGPLTKVAKPQIHLVRRRRHPRYRHTWTCEPGDESRLEELKYWWQRVGTDPHSLEKGLLRFEAYQVIDEDALIIHETFENSNELKFHLSKGTADKYKKDIDKIAAPERCFFRGPVAWTIRTYSKFMHLPATYCSLDSSFTRPGAA